MPSQWRIPLSLDWHWGQGFSHLSPVPPSIAGPKDPSPSPLLHLSGPCYPHSRFSRTHSSDNFPAMTLSLSAHSNRRPGPRPQASVVHFPSCLALPGTVWGKELVLHWGEGEWLHPRGRAEMRWDFTNCSQRNWWEPQRCPVLPPAGRCPGWEWLY